VARYAAQLGDPAVLSRWQQRRRMRVALSSAINQARTDLARIYRLRIAPDAMREAKAKRLAELATAARALGFSSWTEEGLNNAHLASVATYYERVPHFEEMLQRCGGYLPCLYVLAKQEQTR
jgi:predicted aminopeptidase